MDNSNTDVLNNGNSENVVQTSEEVQHIVSKIPTGYGFKITLFVIVLVLILFTSAYIISYPDTAVGQITISTEIPPVKIISSNNGKLILNKKNHENVQVGDLIAHIDNPALITDVQKIDSILKFVSVNIDTPIKIIDNISMFPHRVSMGDINIYYNDFITSLYQYSYHFVDDIYSKQEQTLKSLLAEQNQVLNSNLVKLGYSGKQLEIGHKLFSRDSLLYRQKVTSAAEFDRSEQEYLANKQSRELQEGQIHEIKQSIFNTSHQLEQLEIQKSEKEKSLKLQLLASYNRLTDQIKQWETDFVFRSPQSGKLQFLKFWNTNSFVQNGEALFSVVPPSSKIIGQMYLPRAGIGKVRLGQEVVIKLDDYPFEEFGSLKGRVSKISLSTNVTQTKEGDLENYLVEVELLNNITTETGITLDFKSELKGIAEIITNKKSLLMRLFEKMKSINN